MEYTNHLMILVPNTKKTFDSSHYNKENYYYHFHYKSSPFFFTKIKIANNRLNQPF
jgi:hypothetical protein